MWIVVKGKGKLVIDGRADTKLHTIEVKIVDKLLEDDIKYFQHDWI